MASETPQAENQQLTSLTALEQQLAKIEHRVTPASKEMIQKMLTVIAVTLQLEIPSNEALRSYLHLLKKYPEDLLREAGERVLKEHCYPRFPFPGDFIKHIDRAYEERLDNIRWWKRTLNDRRRGVTIRSEGRADRGPRHISHFLNPPQEKKQ